MATYLACTKIYHEIELKEPSKDDAASIVETIHNHDLYWMNDDALTEEIKMCDHNTVLGVKFINIEYEAKEKEE